VTFSGNGLAMSRQAAWAAANRAGRARALHLLRLANVLCKV